MIIRKLSLFIKKYLMKTDSTIYNCKARLKRNNDKEYQLILNATNFLPNESSFGERIYCIIHNIKERRKCQYCSNYVKYIDFPNGYHLTCGKNECFNLLPQVFRSRVLNGKANKGKRRSDEVNKKKGRPGHPGANKGKTKETHESIRRMADKIRGRNKFNYESYRRMSEEYKKRTKENSEHRRKQAESHYVPSSEECKSFLIKTAQTQQKITKNFLFFLAKQSNFRTKDIERSYDYLREHDFDFYKYFTWGGTTERILEQTKIIPFIKTNLPFASIEKQYRIDFGYKTGIADIVVYSKDFPILIIETKNIVPKCSKAVEKQISSYMKYLNSPYGLVTNGTEFVWYKLIENNCLEKVSEKSEMLPDILEHACSFS